MSIYKDEDQPAGKPKGTLISLDDIVEARWHLAQRGKLNDVELLCAADIVPQPIEWLWPGWLAVGKLAILAGLPGTGKTTLALALAATITRAGHWPDQSPCAKGGRVLVWSGEDDPGDTLVPRLQAAGADLDRVQFLNAVWEQRGKRAFDPADDMPKMATAIERHGDVRLLIIDPIVSAVKGDSHKAAEVRRSLQPIADFAMRQRCAVLGITHFSKGSGGSNPLDRVIGSQAFGALARIVLVAGKSEQGEGRVLARAKSNIGPDDGGVGYTLEDVVLPSGITTSRVLCCGCRHFWRKGHRSRRIYRRPVRLKAIAGASFSVPRKRWASAIIVRALAVTRRCGGAVGHSDTHRRHTLHTRQTFRVGAYAEYAPQTLQGVLRSQTFFIVPRTNVVLRNTSSVQ